MTVIQGDGIYTGWFSLGEIESGSPDFIEATGAQPALIHIHHDFLRLNPDTGETAFQTFETVQDDAIRSPLQLAEELAADGTVLAVTWSMEQLDFSEFGIEEVRINFRELLAGAYDEVLHQGAEEIARYGGPILLNILAEFDVQMQFLHGPDADRTADEVDDLFVHYGDPVLPDAAELVRDAYRYVIDIFDAAGADNATWFMYAASDYMSPEAIDVDPNAAPAFVYPGDDYVDWVGQSVGVSYTLLGGADDKSLEDGLAFGYAAWTAITDNPVFIPELAFQGDGETDRSPLLRETMAALPEFFPAVGAFALTDNENGAALFGTPRLAGPEINTWREAVLDNPAYTDMVVLSEPTPGPAVFRFFNADTGVHFYTASAAERSLVAETLPAFADEGAAFRAADAEAPGATPVFRFFNRETGVHFYTADPAERDAVIGTLDAFVFEGTGFHAYDTPAEDTVPVFRFFNAETGAHFYTADPAERDLVSDTIDAFTFEGTAFYADPL
ncbi:MAG: hypothetical protein GVY09_08290 [Gammaproteobacteria bacterium]|jgi:hypothetical protein|nr:hypothetical protein [Gammaproteobacteria bacterium]